MKTFFMRFTVLFTMIALAFICTFNGYDKAGSAYSAQDSDAVLMDAAVVADLHTRSAINRDENAVLTKLFSGISKSETKLNALVFAGDITNNGTRDEYRCLAAILKRYNKADHLIAATGNHDARGDMDEEDYEENMECYYAFLSVMGVETDKPYWSQDVNGYRFIVLGSEDEEKDRAYITDAQIEWLDAQLSAADESGKPAFIICHQTIDHTNNVDNYWYYDGSIGERSDDVLAVIRSHTDAGLPVVFISGHLHCGFTQYSFENPYPNLYCLNLPSGLYNEEFGQGVTLEAYADRVLIRTRNFITGEWMADEYTVPLA
ncbi:MAG: metallophosphoesterase [Clostridia bacterium]|nr:metallophosphoesterase [Clostridia bacterium]